MHRADGRPHVRNLRAVRAGQAGADRAVEVLRGSKAAAVDLAGEQGEQVNPLGWQYPAGAEHDPRAPYNQCDPDACPECEGGLIQCPECNGVGQCWECDSSGKVRCDECNGTGEEHKPSREEIECDKADRAMDAAKDERE